MSTVLDFIPCAPFSRSAFLLWETLNPSGGTGPPPGIFLQPQKMPPQSKTLLFSPVSRGLGLINDSFLCQGCWTDLEKDAQCPP